MNFRYVQGILVLFGLFLMVTSLSSSVSADSVLWCEGFEDGSCDDWIILYGEWEATDGYLKSLPRTGTRLITHESSQVEGTWSFDIFHESSYASDESAYMFMAFGCGPHLCYGYGVLLSGGSIYFVKQAGDYSTLESLGFVSMPELVNTWTHIDITHNSTTGKFNVFINATSNYAKPDISVVDNDYNYSEDFVVRGIGTDCYLDNIVIDEEIWIREYSSIDKNNTIQTNTTTSSTLVDESQLALDPLLLTFSMGAVATLVVLIGAINLKKH